MRYDYKTFNLSGLVGKRQKSWPHHTCHFITIFYPVFATKKKYIIVYLLIDGYMFVSAGAIIIARRYEVGWLQQLLGEIFGIGGQQHANESRATDLETFGTNNDGPPRESLTIEREETETDNNEPSQESPTTEREGTEMDNNRPAQEPSPTELVATERDNAQPSSSSSTTGPLSTSEPQAPVLRRQCGEIEDEW